MATRNVLLMLIQLCVLVGVFFPPVATAFAAPRNLGVGRKLLTTTLAASSDNDDDVLNKAIEMMSAGGASEMETPDMVQGRIQTLVDQNKVLLFMKGNKSFPQCGFSDTATKILDSFEVDYMDVDVLKDPAIREGVKVFSDWPTIPQLYIDGEFIGGCDIMMEMYQNGELKQMIENLKDE